MQPLLERESDIQIANRLTIKLPRVMVIDDLFGRVHNNGRNEERASLCGQLLLEDVTGDEPLAASERQIIKVPVAQAVFCRGQTPVATKRGDTVENDLVGTLSFVQRHWQPADNTVPLSMVLLDLSFYTGVVTAKSETKRGKGMPEGRDGDDQPSHYFGLQVLKAMHEQFPDLPVVILSSMPREEVKRHYSQMGALAFLPRGNANSPALLQDYLNRHGLIPDYSGTIIGHSISLLKALRTSRSAATSSKNIMILGETGTGKDLLARYLFNQTPGCDKPFVKLNCGNLSSELYVSELFGHVKGAFTGAIEDKKGLIFFADGGDLFLDEIGNMPDKVQAGLLRAIEEKVVVPVGSDKEKKVDVRFLSATNEDIKNKDKFRQDLYYRLTEDDPIKLPSLRERKNDIPLLTEIFIRKAEDSIHNAMLHEIDPDAMDALLSYSWPGNIRELESAICKAVEKSRDVEILSLVHLPIKIQESLKHTQSSAISNKAENITPLGEPATSELNPVPEKASFSELLEQLAAFDFSTAPERRPEWTGKLPALTTAYARAAVALLKASIVVTSKPTPDCPDGEFYYSPAVNLAVGKKIEPDSAKKEIKRILKIAKERFPQEFENDPVLRYMLHL